MEGAIKDGKSKDIGNWACKIQSEDKKIHTEKHNTKNKEDEQHGPGVKQGPAPC
jgi:hypothetical protein